MDKEKAMLDRIVISYESVGLHGIERSHKAYSSITKK